jgi:hypothetical protein
MRMGRKCQDNRKLTAKRIREYNFFKGSPPEEILKNIQALFGEKEAKLTYPLSNGEEEGRPTKNE